MTEVHIFPLRVYFEDTDAGGIVYYANYLKFAERARSEMLRSFGIESARLMQEDNITLTVKNCQVNADNCKKEKKVTKTPVSNFRTYMNYANWPT